MPMTHRPMRIGPWPLEALRSGDPAFEPLPGYFDRLFHPALGSLLTAAADTGRTPAPTRRPTICSAAGCRPTPGASWIS